METLAACASGAPSSTALSDPHAARHSHCLIFIPPLHP